MARKTTNVYVNRKKFGFTLDIDLFNTLDEYSRQTGIPKSKVIDFALELYFKEKEFDIVKDGE